MSKYSPLARHLAKLPLSTKRWRPLFKELEEILTFPLPTSARSYAAWWANDRSHPQKLAWLNAGWRTEELDLGAERVTFCREPSPRSAPAQKTQRTTATMQPSQGAKARPECELLWSWDTLEQHGASIAYSWQPIGRVLLDEGGKLCFPKVAPEPGVYRLRLKFADRSKDYIGESDNLRRRFQNYRQGPERQQTSHRINKALHQALKDGAEVSVALMNTTEARKVGEKHSRGDLSSKAARCLFENLALVMSGANDVELLNR